MNCPASPFPPPVLPLASHSGRDFHLSKQHAYVAVSGFLHFKHPSLIYSYDRWGLNSHIPPKQPSPTLFPTWLNSCFHLVSSKINKSDDYSVALSNICVSLFLIPRAIGNIHRNYNCIRVNSSLPGGYPAHTVVLVQNDTCPNLLQHFYKSKRV